jgi:hypothetical protein
MSVLRDCLDEWKEPILRFFFFLVRTGNMDSVEVTYRAVGDQYRSSDGPDLHGTVPKTGQGQPTPQARGG